MQFAICNLQFAIIFSLYFSTPAVAAAEKTRRSMDQVVTLPVESDPTVCFRLWFKVGSQNDPPGKEGLAALTVADDHRGIDKSNSYEEMLDRLFPMAGSYIGRHRWKRRSFPGGSTRTTWINIIRLLMQAVMEPAFKQDDLDRLKSDALNYLENTLRYSSDEDLGKAVLYNTIFRGTPYGHLPAGTIDGVKSITVEDVRNFYRKYYTRENVVIGLGGGYDERLLERIRTDLAALPRQTRSPFRRPSPPKINGLQVKIVEKDCSATAISMGFPITVARRKGLVRLGCGQFVVGRASQSEQPFISTCCARSGA